jgi:SrtB family sortase
VDIKNEIEIEIINKYKLERREGLEEKGKENKEETVKYEPPETLVNLVNEYEDVKGYLFVEGTNISYPVLSCEEEGFYLHKNMDKKYSYAGCIFLDNLQYCENASILCIHGHNMKNGTMFHDLRYFLNSEQLKEKKVELYEMERLRVFEPVYCYMGENDKRWTEIINDEGEAGRKVSEITKNEEASGNYLILITCAEIGKKKIYLVCKEI